MHLLIIPEQYRSGLIALYALSDSEVDVLAKALEDLPPAVRIRKDITAVVSPQLASVPAQTVTELVRTLHSLYQVRALSDKTLDEFVSDLADAMASSGIPELVPADQPTRERLVKKIITLLSASSLNFLAKANALQRDHEHIFHDAKIITDLRPVFRTPDEAPRDMIVEYTLKIVFHDGSRHKEIYMTLDSDDIARLRTTLDRADTKAASLKSLLESKGLAHLPSLSEV